jgi:hypothetical protein
MTTKLTYTQAQERNLNWSNVNDMQSTLLDVAIQDQSTPLVDSLLVNQIELEIATLPTIGSYDINVIDATGVIAGCTLDISYLYRTFQVDVLSVADNTITVDTPVDFAYPVVSKIICGNKNLNVNGSSTYLIASIAPPSGVKWDITRGIFNMSLSTAGSDALFGDIAALNKGIVLRKSGDDGISTLLNAKTNGDLALRMYDIEYSDRAVPSQTYGLRGRRSFNGQDKNGVVIRLDGSKNDKAEILIQDDLTDLVSFNIVVQGHVVEE